MTVLNEKGQAHISLVHELFLIDLDPGGTRVGPRRQRAVGLRQGTGQRSFFLQ